MRNIHQKALAFIFLLLVILSSVNATAMTPDHKWLVSGKKTAAYLRIFADPNTNSSWIGHYDLQISGKLRIGKYTFTDPCFSYSSGGFMYIFSANDTSAVYKGRNYNKCRAYTMRFSIPTSGLSSFIKYLGNQFISVKAVSSKRALKCNFKYSSPFISYNTATVNCFSAVAYWLRGFGNNTLWKIYSNVYKTGKNYLPATFIKYYISKLTRIK